MSHSSQHMPDARIDVEAYVEMCVLKWQMLIFIYIYICIYTYIQNIYIQIYIYIYTYIYIYIYTKQTCFCEAHTYAHEMPAALGYRIALFMFMLIV